MSRSPELGDYQLARVLHEPGCPCREYVWVLGTPHRAPNGDPVFMTNTFDPEDGEIIFILRSSLELRPFFAHSVKLRPDLSWRPEELS